jgi:hypothetical protein
MASTTQGIPDMQAGDGRRRSAWKPIEIIAMVLGFIFFWPIGLAILGVKIWQKRAGHDGDMVGFVQSQWREKSMGAWSMGCRGRNDVATRWSAGNFGMGGFGAMRSTGNVAFDEWRATELARLEEERRKLADAEREFADHMENLRRARDREEFERFMSARAGRGPGAPNAS